MKWKIALFSVLTTLLFVPQAFAATSKPVDTKGVGNVNISVTSINAADKLTINTVLSNLGNAPVSKIQVTSLEVYDKTGALVAKAAYKESELAGLTLQPGDTSPRTFTTSLKSGADLSKYSFKYKTAFATGKKIAAKGVLAKANNKPVHVFEEQGKLWLKAVDVSAAIGISFKPVASDNKLIDGETYVDASHFRKRFSINSISHGQAGNLSVYAIYFANQ